MDQVELERHLTVDGTEYEIAVLEAREALDELSILTCEITDNQGGPAPAGLVDKTLVLEVKRANGTEEKKIVGYVVEAQRTTTRGDQETGTRLVVRPRLYRLTQRADCRVYQDMSAVDIVKDVLNRGGVPDSEWKTTGSYPKRVYTTQYRETDFDFIHRLLSEEGIAFAIDSSSGKDVVVFFDTDRGPIDGAKTLVYRPGDGLSASGDGIGAISHETRTTPGKVNLRDYDFERPRLQLDAKQEGDEDGEKPLEVYQYPGRFTDPSNGDRLAKVLLQSLRARREVVGGPTNSLRLLPGQLFSLDEHPYAPLNQEYLVLEVTTSIESGRHARRHRKKFNGSGQGPGSISSSGQAPGSIERDVERSTHHVGERLAFRAVPTGKDDYRPPRVPRAIASPGAQVAVITGAPGQEIHPDKYGRVKVQFPWDRLGKKDDTSSLWIRTCQLPLGGSMFTPRVGWEAYLNFTDGDPDMPFVFGRMYNAEKPPPYELPKHKTRMSIQTATTPGGGSTNELRMDDKAGGEEMFMNASKDASVSAGNNATEVVGNNESRTIGANQSLSITDSMAATIGANQSSSIGGNQTLHVATKMVDDVGGSHTLAIGGNRDLKAGGDHKRTVTGASTLTVSGLQVDLVAGSSDENGMDTMSDHVGAALVELTASDRTLTIAGNRTEKAGAAKVILSSGGRAVTTANLKQKVAGAVLTKIKGDRSDSSEGDFLEVAGGAQLIKATNVVFQAESLLSVVMGASTITLTKASVSIAGTKITLDGDVADEAALIVDNC